MIGICDSGIGGLTVAKEVMQHLPGFSFVYIGDTARTPYGNKSADAICRYALENVKFLVNHGAKIILIACNSMSAVALPQLRERFHIPIFEVIGPAVAEAIRVSPFKNIGVIGTRATIGSGVYDRLIHGLNHDASVTGVACPLFVPFVEEGMANHSLTKKIARLYLDPLRQKQVDTLVLGCTHYPFLKNTIADRMGHRVHIVDSAATAARHLQNYLDANPSVVEGLHKGNRHEFYLTDIAPHHNRIASAWLGQPINFIPAQLIEEQINYHK